MRNSLSLSVLLLDNRWLIFTLTNVFFLIYVLGVPRA